MFEPHEITASYTEEQLIEARKIFATAPSFDGTSLSASDIADYCEHRLKMKRTPEQWAAYVRYFDKRHGGRINLDDLMELARWNHNIQKYFEKYAQLCDKNKNGFLDEKEFQEILEIMKMHSGKGTTTETYSDFIRAADKNGDGKVSIEECARWIVTQFS